MMKYVFTLILTLLAITTTIASVTQWKTLASGRWHDPGNWSNGVPTALDSALINQGNVTVTIDQDASALHLFIMESSSVLLKERMLTISGAPGHGIVCDGTFDNSGSVEITKCALIGFVVEGTLTNRGKLSILGSSGGINIEAGGFLENLDSILISDSYYAYQGGGVLLNQGGGFFSIEKSVVSSFQQARSSIWNSGILQVKGEGYFLINNSDLNNSGIGSIHIDVVNQVEFFGTARFFNYGEFLAESDNYLALSNGSALTLYNNSSTNFYLGSPNSEFRVSIDSSINQEIGSTLNVE